MKKYIYKIAIFASVAFFASCEKGGDPVIFDNQNGQTLVSFANTSADLAVQVDATGSVEIPIEVSTISSTERTFPVSVVDEETTADPTSYSFGSIVIPANTYNATLTLDGIDNNVEVESKALVLSIDEGDGYVTGPNITVSVFQVCPVETGFFLGDYAITILSPGVFGEGTYGPTGTVVEIRQGTGEFDRVFTANYFSDPRFPRDFRFSLVCNEIIVPFQDHAVGCGGNSVNLNTGAPAVNGTFDATDDSSFIINITDNVDSDCGGSPVQASYRFDKL